MVPAAEAILSTSTAAPTTAPPSAEPEVAPPETTVAPRDATTDMDQVRANEEYTDRRDRFIKATDSDVIWFQDAEAPTKKHLVRSGCKACGDPPPCQNSLEVSSGYIEKLSPGQDFQCDMLTGSMDNGIAWGYATTQSTTVVTTTTTTTTEEEAAGGGFGMRVFIGILCLAALAGLCALAYFFTAGSKRKSKKKTRSVGKRREEEDGHDEDQVPLVLGQEEGIMPSPSFGTQGANGWAGGLGQRERAAATAPTYTAMTPHMGQAQLAAQTAMASAVQQQASLPTVTHVPQGPMMPTQAWMVPQGMGGPLPTQAAVPPQAMPGTYNALQTQAAFSPPEQEMELVTVTPNGLAVTPLPPGQGVPQGVPVLSAAPTAYV